MIRTRFAPSPTGSLHIGGLRTALFNFLYSRKNNGKFVLRIEDTDTERSQKEYEHEIIASLAWLGINYDEGPDNGGPYGPYRQSERLDIYKKYLQKLLDEKKAYYCFCPEDELESLKQYQASIGEPPHYNGKCSQFSDKQIQEYLKTKKSVIRFKVPEKKVEFEDEIRKEVEFDTHLMGDVVIAKDLESPLYNFACVVDDFEMNITHVIRGEEHISNTPKQILMQEALNLPKVSYTHLPLILAPDRTKLSKRHGATSVEEFKNMGYLPEAIINFIAFLGWNPGENREIFSLSNLIKEFSLEKCQKSNAVFNIKKLDFINGFYIRQKPIEKLAEMCAPYLIEAGLIKEKELEKGILVSQPKNKYEILQTKEGLDEKTLENIVFLYQERIKKLSEITDLVDFFFQEKLNYDKSLLSWKEMSEKDVLSSLDITEKLLLKIKEANWTKENLSELLLVKAEEIKNKDTQKDRGYLLWPLRVCLSGKESSASPFEIAEVLGKEKTLKRIKQAKSLL